MTKDLPHTRKRFLAALDATGADMLDVMGWEKAAEEQARQSKKRLKMAPFFSAHHLTLSFMGQVLAETRHPEIAIFLAASAAQARDVLVEAMIRPDLHYRTHRFSSVAGGLDQYAIEVAMEAEDADLWSKAFQQSLSHHGQMALLAGLRPTT